MFLNQPDPRLSTSRHLPAPDVCPATSRRAFRTSPLAINLLAAATFVWFLFDGFVAGWSRPTTDFPNYYTAARLTLARAQLPSFYDYPAFQREIGRAGNGLQIGGYVPQTPLAMLPLIPLSGREFIKTPAGGKHAWLTLNLGFLALALWLLSQIVTFNVQQLWLIVFLEYGALRPNFLLGQYYVLLFALLATSTYALLRNSDRAAGSALGLAFILKLYGAPFLPVLAAKRRWHAVLAMLVLLVLGVALAAALFGWNDIVFYCFHILPRSLAGETLDPYHPSNNTFVSLFRRLFVAESSLNPHPLLDSPATFAFLQWTFTSLILLLPVLAACRNPGVIAKSEIAWWSVALLLLSPNTASYTFCLLTLPVVLLLDELPLRRWPYILLPYFVLTLPLRASWSFLFPKAVLLLGLFIGIGIGYRYLTATLCAVAITISLAAGTAGSLYAPVTRETPAPSAVEIAASPGGIYSASPAISRSGVFYEAITGERYVIGQWNEQREGNALETWTAAGHSFHPSVSDTAGRVYFELDSGGHSSIAFFDLATRRQSVVPIDLPEAREPAVSPDGADVAFLSRGRLYLLHDSSLRKLDALALPCNPSFAPDGRSLVYAAGPSTRSIIVRLDLAAGKNTILIDGPSQLASPALSRDSHHLLYAALDRYTWQLWLANLDSPATRPRQLTTGRCNSWSPAWSPESDQVIFASDCKRGLHLPALFRMPLNLSK